MKEILISELQQIRKETLEAIQPIPDSELEWAPATGMRTYAGMLIEIGGMEWRCTAQVFKGTLPSWDEADKQIDTSSFENVVRDLATIRQALLDHLQDATEDDLRKPITVSAGWAEFFGTAHPEAHEMIRWIAMHEYYHLGQIISYRWSQGFNPYADEAQG